MSVEDRKAWEKQQRENRIVDIARDIFFKNGYEMTTIIEIATASGYNKRSIYLYFRDKEEIFLAVVLRGLIRMHRMLEAASDKADIRSLGKAFFDFSLDHPDYLKLIMVYEANICIYTPDSAEDPRAGRFKNACQEKTDTIAQLITEIIEKEVAGGRIHTRLEPPQLMLLLWGQVFGVMQIILMRKKDFEATYGISYEDLFDTFMKMTSAALKQAL